MPCILILLLFGAPRLALAVIWLFGEGWLGRAFDTNLWPLLGFLLLPWTTLAYAFAMNDRHELAGIHLVLFVLAILVDLGSIGGSRKQRRN